MSAQPATFPQSVLAGGAAGLAVDVALYPIDTIKTRLQSSQGFIKSGGFRGIYKGLSAVVIGSAPGSALFFAAYDSLKHSLSSAYPQLSSVKTHMIAASMGEICACTIRVPTDALKQRMQVGRGGLGAVVSAMRTSGEGLWQGLYSGFGITLMREIPFALIQFPLYESLKKSARERSGSNPSSFEAAVYGSISGGIAAAATTPLDVVRTRLMLGDSIAGGQYRGIFDSFARIYREEGPRSFMAGVQPRMMWISIGGFVYFGAYEQCRRLLQ